MKKLLAKIVCMMIVLAMAITTLAGCSDSKWSGLVTLKNSGAVVKNGNGGFIAETENYVYFINGVGLSTASNKMGDPLKGALMVADKADLTKAEVVVPKLMVATDYNMGVFIDNGYAYYGTPNIEISSAGTVAYNQMVFMRTKLDGSGKTDEFFVLDSLSTQYRIVKADNVVYIYYFENDALYCYNTTTNQNSLVIKMDSTDNTHIDDNGKYYTLEEMKLVGSDLYDEDDKVVAYFTATVYQNEYKEEFAQAGYERAVETYNKVYAIKAGNNTPVEIVSGKMGQEKYNVKYQISLLADGYEDDYLFYNKTESGLTKSYAISLSDALDGANWLTKSTEIVNQDYIMSTNYFYSLEKVYVVGQESVYKTDATKKAVKEPVLAKEGVNRLIKITNEGGVEYLYYYNTLNNIVRVDLEDTEKVVRISDNSVATNWYAPEFITINGKDYIFYCDNSVYGKSYVEFVDLSAEIVGEDTDEDEKEDSFFLKEEDIKELGIKTNIDKADIVSEKIKALELPEKGLGDDQEKDAEFMEEYQKVLDEYNGLKTIKGLVATEQAQKLINIEKAFEVMAKYEKLEGIRACVDADEAIEKGLKTEYLEVKAYLQTFKSIAERDNVDDMISTNLKANYTKAVELFEEEQK